MNEGWNDSLFKFFRSKLNDSANFAEEWTTPPDDIFDKAIQEVGLLRQKRRRKLLIPWMLALGLLIMVSGSYLIYTQLIQTKQRVDQLEERVHNLESTTEMANIEDASSDPELGLVDKVSSIISNQVTLPNQNYNKVNDRDEFRNTNRGQVAERALPIEALQSGQATLEETQKQQLGMADGRASIAVDDLVMISQRMPSLLTLDAPVIQSDLGITGHPKMEGKYKGRYLVSLSGGQNFSSFSMTNTGGSDASLTRYDRYYTGGGLNISLEYLLNDKWSVVLSGAYSQLNNRSLLVDRMNYNSSNEHSDPAGNSIYETELTLETPLGSLRRSAEVPMNDLKMNDGDKILSSTTISQDLEVTSGQVGVRYYLARAGKWQAFSGIGAGLDYIIRSDSDMHSEISMKDHIMKEMDSSTSELDYLQKRYATAHLEAGLKYQVGNRVNLLVDTKFRQSLTSLRDPGHDKGPKTFLQQFRTAIGVELEF